LWWRGCVSEEKVVRSYGAKRGDPMSETTTGNRESVLSSLRARLATSLARDEVAAAALGLNARIRFSTNQGASDIFAVDGVVTINVASGSPDVCISAPDSAWNSALEALPQPGFQSFTAWQISNELSQGSGLSCLLCSI
jgi:hypothetical protein